MESEFVVLVRLEMDGRIIGREVDEDDCVFIEDELFSVVVDLQELNLLERGQTLFAIGRNACQYLR